MIKALDLDFLAATPSSMAEWPAPRGAGGGLGEATYFNAQGVRRIAAAGEWRIDHDPITRARRGLLLEPTKTNFVRQIVRNGNAVGLWSQGGGGTATATVTPNFSLAVDGNQTAARVLWVGPNVGTVSQRVPTSGVPVGTVCTVSFYAFTRSLGNATSALVDLMDGPGGGDILSQFVLNQWVRVVAAGVVSGTNAASQWVDLNFFGFTTGEIDIDIEGIQVEEGAFATSLMLPSLGGVGPVTRQQDTGSIAVTSLASATLYLEERTVAQAASGSLGGAWADDGTANNRLAATAEGGVGYAPTVTGAGMNIATFSTAAIADGVVDRLAVSYAPNAMAAALDGVSLGTDASGTLSANISRVALPAGDRVRHLRALRLYAAALTAPQLQALTLDAADPFAVGITFPAIRRPAEAAERLLGLTQIHQSPFDGTVQTLEMPGARWELSATWPTLGPADRRLMAAFLASLRGRAGRFPFSPAQWSPRRATGGGTPLINGDFQTGTTLSTRGWTALATVMLAGDWLSYVDTRGRRRLHMVLADATADGNGIAPLYITPPIRRAGADGAPVEIVNPAGVFMLPADEAPNVSIRAPNFGQVQITMQEALA